MTGGLQNRLCLMRVLCDVYRDARIYAYIYSCRQCHDASPVAFPCAQAEWDIALSLTIWESVPGTLTCVCDGAIATLI